MARRRLWTALLIPFVITAGVGLLITSRFLDQPEAALLPDADEGAGGRFQQSVAQLILRQGGLSRRTDPIVVTGAEINAFLARHVDVRRVTLRPVVVRVGDGWLEVAGRTSLRRLLGSPSVRWLAHAVPDTVQDLQVWLAARGRLRIGEGAGELVVDRATIGRQAVPQEWLWSLLNARPSDLLVWPLPRIVECVELEEGRLVIHTRPRRAERGREGC